MNNFIDIFPTRVYKFKLNSHEEIKSQYLDSIIQSYEDNLYEVPEDWETNKISTSFNSKQIIKSIPKEYCEVFDKVFDKPWSGTFSYWHNVCKNGEYQETHHHLPAYYSAIHFLKFDNEEHMPPVFYDPNRLVNYRYAPQKFTPSIEEGDVLIFPSHLEHFVPGKDYKTHRVTISFNLTLDD